MTPTEKVNCPDWIRVTEAEVPPGTSYWRLKRVEYQDDQQSGGTHHIYALSPHDPAVRMMVSNGQSSWSLPLEKPTNEPATNFAMWSQNHYSAQMEGAPSDRVEGMHMPSNHHVSYLLTWERATKEGSGVSGQEDDIPIPHEPPTALEKLLLAEGDARQVLRFNPTAAIQKAIFAAGFVPNSAEFNLSHKGTPYTAQRAERLSDGAVRVFYVRAGEWANVQWVERG